MKNLNNSYFLENRKIKSIVINPIQYLIGVIYCCIISYFIALYFSSNILYHTDTFAPIEEIKLLANMKSINLTNIHLARIPSLFPDLTLIYVLIKVFQINDIFSIISSYAIINSFLLLVSLSLIASVLVNKKFSFLYSSFLISTFSLFLIKKSAFYCEVLAQYLTPLHQGGNIIMTLIGIIIIFQLFVAIRIRFVFNIFVICLIPAFLGFSISSNKLFIFTFLLPLFLVLIYIDMILTSKSLTSNMYTYTEKKRGKFLIYIHKVILRLKPIIIDLISAKKHKKLLFLSLPIFLITFSLQFSLDLQCLDPLNFKILKPIKELNNFILQDFSLGLFFLANLGLVLYSFYSLYKNIKGSNIFFNQSKSANLLMFKSELIGAFIGISSLSPLLYIWITNNVISRYLLILPLLMPLSIFIIIDLAIKNITENKLKNIINMSFKILIIGISIYSFNTNIISSVNLNKSFKPRDIFYNAALIQRSEYANDYKQILSLGLEKGLSDFWGSSVSYFGEKQIKVSPVLNNGLPNLWSHSIYNFKNNNLNQTQKYNFIYSREFNFTKSMIDIFGKPDKIYKIQDTNKSPLLIKNIDAYSNNHIILIYDNQDFYNKLNVLFKDRPSKGCRNY